MTTYWCELAWLGGPSVAPGVVVTAADQGTIDSVTSGVVTPPPGAVRLAGLTLPGLANVHSHAFHRALRGHTHRGPGSFWTWREQMYHVSDRLDPERYHRLARATYAEMARAGVCVVGEFHYLHHQPGGSPYSDPNAMGEAVIAAAAEAGVRITLLDSCYLHGGLTPDGYQPIADQQRRFSDGDADRWAERVGALVAGPNSRIGAAVHSIRAVDPESNRVVAEWAGRARAPVHVHLSEQPAENEQSLAGLRRSPTAVLDEAGLLETDVTTVHATHLEDRDVERLGAAGAGCCFCPTTERDLADGIGPSRQLADAGASLCLGSDSHAMIDLFEEARALELDCRLASLRRGNHSPEELLTALTVAGHRALGWGRGGRLRAGALCDLTTIGLDSVRLAGTTTASALAAAVFVATAADVTNVVIGGETVVRDGRHVSIDVAGELSSAVAAVIDP